MDEIEIKHFIEAALLAAGRPMNLDQLRDLFDGRSAPEKSEIRKVIKALNEEYDERGVTIAEVASGFRIQVKAAMADRLHKLWEERPPRYSRALFETLALIAYRQPITRGEIEEVRGVTVSANIVRTLMERDWVRIVGHRDVPGRPAMFGTTKAFLDYFGLKKLDDLPELTDLADWEALRVQLNLPEVEGEAGEGGVGVPVLYPEDKSANEDGAVDDAAPDPSVPAPPAIAEEIVLESSPDDDATVADDAANDVQTLVEEAFEADEELVVSEWPDPAESRKVTTLDTHDPDDDKDASAGAT